MTDLLPPIQIDHQDAKAVPHPISSSRPGGPALPGGQGRRDTHSRGVAGEPSADGQTRPETQNTSAIGNLSTPPKVRPQPILTPAGSTLSQPSGDSRADTQSTSDGWLELRIWAEMFNDAQQARIAAVNQAERGGVDPIIYTAHIDRVTAAEAECKKALIRCYRRITPPGIRQFQQEQRGIGEHEMARLLGHLGHPIIATPHHWEGTGAKRHLVGDEPFARTVSQLWQYCGHGKPGRARKGASADDLAALGSPMLKAQVWRMATSMAKAGVRTIGVDDKNEDYNPDNREAISRYGDVYLATRRAVADKVHTVDCVRCGPSGKPALEGSPWSSGHRHAHSLRIVGKTFLRDLWLAAHEAAS